jgi:hypothetical protein
MRKSTTTQKSVIVQSQGSSRLSATLKSTQTKGPRKRSVGKSTRETATISRNHDTRSDTSADDAEEMVPPKIRRVSIIHSYADKLSDREYKCTICSKVRNL